MIDTWVIGVLALINLIISVTNKDSRFNLLAGILLGMLFIFRFI